MKKTNFIAQFISKTFFLFYVAFKKSQTFHLEIIIKGMN